MTAEATALLREMLDDDTIPHIHRADAEDILQSSPRAAHGALLVLMKDLGNGPVWKWCNSTAAPDATTAAYMQAAQALDDLRRHLAFDEAEAYAREATA